MAKSVDGSDFKPRLCHVKKWSDFNGYGFNLHAEKGKAGQFIGKVDAGSPAESAGLNEGDRIIEVNGTNIGNENHAQVVQRIKVFPTETKLLVLDAATDAYFREKKIVVRGDMPYVEIIECPDEKGGEVIRTTVGVDSGAPAPRQCHLRIWPDFQGYGFNLHAEKGKPGQFIGKVDDGSPAEAAGLKQGDRIVEVNEQFIGNDNHGEVVQKIKQDATKTTMLVVDEETENYYKQKSIQVSSKLPNVKNIYCPASKEEYTVSDFFTGTDKSEQKPGSSTQAEVNAAPPPAPAEDDDANAPLIRLCHLKIWSDYKGYGFNLQSEKNAGSQFIGSVEPDSPAAAAGLRNGDKIIEVNGTNVQSKSHGEVVQLVKADPTQTRMLVLDQAGFDYYKEKGVTVTANSPNVERIVCPDSKPAAQEAAVSSAPAPVAAPVTVEENAPAPRLCKLKKWSDYQGYGFNLHAEKEKGKGQYIGKVDEGGPAEAAGLLSGDKIIEVNGRNMESEDHGKVVGEIKTDPTQVSLLVLDPEGFTYYRSRGVTVTGSDSNVKVISCPDSKLANGTSAVEHTKVEVNHTEVNGAASKDEQATNQADEDDNGLSDGDAAAAAIVDSIREAEQEVKAAEEKEEKQKQDEKKEEEIQQNTDELDVLQDYEVVTIRSQEEKPAAAAATATATAATASSDSTTTTVTTTTKTTTTPAPVTYDNIPNNDEQAEYAEVNSPNAEAVYAEVERPSAPAASPPVVVGGIEFSSSAAEARQRLSKRSSRKHEVKKQEVSMKDKYELFQKL